MSTKAEALISIFVIIFVVGWAPTSARRDPEQTIQLCELLREAQRYDGQKVSIAATYRVAYEASELYCLSCLGKGRVWVEFDSEQGGPDAGKRIGRLAKDQGTINGLFSGVFHAGGAYGHQAAYSYELSIESAQNLRLVHHLAFSPSQLPASVRQRVCQ